MIAVGFGEETSAPQGNSVAKVHIFLNVTQGNMIILM